MAKNVRIVPASGSIFFTGDGFDVTGSIRLQTVGSTENVQFTDGDLKVNNKGILQLSEYQGNATAVEGGILYSGSNLFIGD